MKYNKFMRQMGTLQIEAYNEGIEDAIEIILILCQKTEPMAILTTEEIIKEIELLKIN